MATAVMAVTMLSFCVTVFYLVSKMTTLPVHPHGYGQGVAPLPHSEPRSTASNTVARFSDLLGGQFFGFLDVDDCEDVAAVFGESVVCRMNPSEDNVPASFVVFGVEKGSDIISCQAFPASSVGYRDPSVEIVAPENLTALSRTVESLLEGSDNIELSPKAQANADTLNTLVFFAHETLSTTA